MRKSLFTKFIVFFLVVTLTISISICPAGASNPFGYKLINGISNISWTYVNPNNYANNYSISYLTQAQAALNSWENSISGCDLTYETYNPNNYTYDVYYCFGDYGADGFYAGVYCYDANGNRVNPGNNYPIPTEDYDYVIVRCNQNYLKDVNRYLQVRSCFAHEMGHAFGLNHMLYDTTVLMYIDIMEIWNYYGTGVYSPQTDDINGVNSIY